MKTKIAFLITASCVFSFASQQLMAQAKTSKKETMTKTQSTAEHQVKISTSYGDMVVKLYNETPLHRDNFLKLTKEKFFDSLLFHRVIKGLMLPLRRCWAMEITVIPSLLNSTRNCIIKKERLLQHVPKIPKRKAAAASFILCRENLHLMLNWI
jgi:hypothetical protein